MLSSLILVAVTLVAYANGANSSFKGVASLFGSGTCSYRTAIRWAAITTAAGAVASMFFATQLLKAFSGKGLVSDALAGDPVFLLAVALGAMATGGLATRLGFPVSTTHALTGALVGAGLCANAEQVAFSQLWKTFGQPLLLGPMVAILLAGLLHWFLGRMRLEPNHRTPLLDALHFLSGGAVCFARGLNDTPKMAALLGCMASFTGMNGMLLVTLAMTAGLMLSARRVAETLAHKITDMNPGQGFVANATTAILVILGSLKGLPLSTTHVTVGSLLGIGIATRQTHWRTVIPVLLAWVITLPCAAMLAAFSFAVGRHFFGVN